MVIGGSGIDGDGRKINSFEPDIIDLSGQQRSHCHMATIPSDYIDRRVIPLKSGTFQNGQALVCSDNDHKRSWTLGPIVCYEHDKQANRWAVTKKHRGSYFKWWYSNNMYRQAYAKKIFNQDTYAYQVVRLNNTMTLLVSSFLKAPNLVGTKVNLVDQLSEITALPNTINSHYSCSGGLAYSRNGDVSIVLTGHESTEIYSFQQNKWRVGRRLPVLKQVYGGGISVPFKRSFIVFGIQGPEQNLIYYFNPDSENWEILTEKQPHRRSGAVAFFVSNDYVQCDG